MAKTVEGPDPEVAELVASGEIVEVMAWLEAVAEEERRAELTRDPDPECDRLMCENTPDIVCRSCNAQYCNDHPPVEDGDPNTCDKCGFNLSPDNPYADRFEETLAEEEKQREKEREDQKSLEAELKRRQKARRSQTAKK